MSSDKDLLIDIKGGMKNLTELELAVLKYRVLGYTYREIALFLNITQRRASLAMKRAKRKLLAFVENGGES